MKALRKLLVLLLCLVCFVGITACKEENPTTSTPSQSESSTGDNSSSNGDGDSSQDGPSHEHNYTLVVTEPTCTEKGFTTHSCSCGNSYKDTYTSALNHSFTNYVYNNDAKCGVNGTETAICANGCKKEDTRIKAGTALTHSFIDYVSDNNATYERDGTKTAKCTHGCGSSDTVADVGSMLVRNGLTFKTLSVNGTNVYGKVSNTTETFSFINEIAISGKTKFIVSIDIYGVQQVATKTIPLEIGDNTVYITEMVDNEPVNVYTVNVRRRPMYNVTFNANGGSSVMYQTVEEDTILSSPSTFRQGYTFADWDYDFTKPISKDTEITANWTANNNTPYKVEFYLQNLENDEYTLETTENKTGTTDTTANAEIKRFTHFTHAKTATEQGNIAPDGSTVLKVYYTRDKYTVTFNGNGGALSNGNATQIIKYQGDAITPVFIKNGYELSWDKAFTNVSEDIIVMANWQAVTYNIAYENLKGADNPNIGITTYTVESGTTTLKNPTVEPDGYYFSHWEMDGKMITAIPIGEFGDKTIAAVWRAIFTVENGILTSYHGKANNVEIIIPANVDGVAITCIGASVFEGCSNLEKVVVPDCIRSISSYAFYGCSRLESIVIPDSVTDIGSYAFYGCSSLGSIVIPGKVTSIGEAVFAHCCDMSRVIIGENVTYIGKQAFNDCYKLASIRIPDSVTHIGKGAFQGCNSLTEITIPFIGCAVNDSSNVHFGYIFGAGSSDYNDEYVPASLKTVIITSATSIGRYAFYDCRNLVSVTIPDSVTSIDYGSFGYCYLTSIEVDEKNKAYKSIDGNLYSKDGKTFIQYAIGKTEINFSIPDDVMTIVDYALCGSNNLKSISIPDSVTSIPSGALQGCNSLMEITIPFLGNTRNDASNKFLGYIFGAGSSTYNDKYVPESLKTVVITSATSIEKRAFYKCSGLTSVTLPDSLTSIPDEAFQYCSSLTNLKMGKNLENIGHSIFYACDRLKSITIPSSVTDIHSTAFVSWSVTNIEVDENNTTYKSIDGNLYSKDGKTLIQYAIGKTEISFLIPNGVETIDDLAFYNCDSLERIVMPDSVKSLGFRAFSNCISLTEAIFSDNLTNVGDYAFEYCLSLLSINIPDSVTTIGESAFYYCVKLSNVTLGNGVISIDFNAFWSCSSLKTINIPKSVKIIGNYAFGNSSVLTNITYDGTVAEWKAISKSEYWAQSIKVYIVQCVDGFAPI